MRKQISFVAIAITTIGLFSKPLRAQTGQQIKPDVVAAPASPAYSILHSFSGPDGSNPQAGLIQATDGNFYGTTAGGGSSSLGTIFRTDTAGNVTSLHSFTFQDGADPVAPLVQGKDGMFYGTAAHTQNLGVRDHV